MPFISFKTNIDLEETEIKNIEKAAGKYISKLDEKDESQLMTSFESDIPMMFRGEDDPCMMIHMDVFGDPDKKQLDEFFSALCDHIEDEINLDRKNIYMNVTPFYSWGANGRYN